MRRQKQTGRLWYSRKLSHKERINFHSSCTDGAAAKMHEMNILEETSAAPVLSPCKCYRSREISTAARGQSESGFWKNIHFMHKRQPLFLKNASWRQHFFCRSYASWQSVHYLPRPINTLKVTLSGITWRKNWSAYFLNDLLAGDFQVSSTFGTKL